MRVYSVRPLPPASRPRRSKLRLVRPVLRAFPCVRGEGWYHTTLSALYVLLKRRTSACQSGSFVVFCGRTAIIDSSGVKFDPTHNLENFKIILIFLITCGMVVLLEIKPLHRSYYVGKL